MSIITSGLKDDPVDITGVDTHTVNISKSGLYQIEAWGCPGGDAICSHSSEKGGRGGYVKGYAVLATGDTLTVELGTNSNHISDVTRVYKSDKNGYVYQYIASGGYRVRILKDTTVLLVAAGGGGAVWGGNQPSYAEGSFAAPGGVGGGLTGGPGSWFTNNNLGWTAASDANGSMSTGGTQNGNGSYGGTPFEGYGGATKYGGAGGGYYRGGCGAIASDRCYRIIAGAGGSSYIGGCPTVSFNGKEYPAETIYGGNIEKEGKARITLIASSFPDVCIDSISVSSMVINDIDITDIIIDGVQL